MSGNLEPNREDRSTESADQAVDTETEDPDIDTKGKAVEVPAEPPEVQDEDDEPIRDVLDPYSMPIRGHSNTGPRRRRFTPKSRSGCVTCKKRKVRCDEARPSCLNCQKKNIECEGYDPPKAWVFDSTRSSSTSSSTSSQLTTLQPLASLIQGAGDTSRSSAVTLSRTTSIEESPIPITAAGELSLPIPASGTENPSVSSALPLFDQPSLNPLHPLEAQAFQFYLTSTAPLMDRSSDVQLFSRVVPEVAVSHPSILYSMLACAAADECLIYERSLPSSISLREIVRGDNVTRKQDPQSELRWRRGMQWYGRSIREVMRNPLTPEQTILNRIQLEAILITSILLLGYEYWCGNMINGGKHIMGAVQLLESHDANDNGKGKGRTEEAGTLETVIRPSVERYAACHQRNLQEARSAEQEEKSKSKRPKKR